MKTSLLSLAAAFGLLASTAALAAPAPDHRDDDRYRREYNKYDDRNNRDFNYGFNKKHRVTPAEKARWEAQHRNDGRDDDRRSDYDRRNDRNDRDFNYGFDKKHRVTPAEKARWEAQHRYEHR
ncbi:hypothetical protein [Hymenobacter rigui]|uniref:Uncharacterized protein n=1 Tax=Hymenobacter rigui TaxID=334424 RepID=A0A3R9N5V1_9BACT|nr:hypothetical protein [Hymenobacter rigui]RSK48923.1 hypothetical protein EI291_10205 [Hymenobacter rigui]